MKRNLMDEVGVLLLRHGYTVKTLTGNSLDIVARKESRVLLIKVLEDANSISEDFADSMKNLSSYAGDKNKKKLPSLQKRDFLDFGSAKDLIRFLREFE